MNMSNKVHPDLLAERSRAPFDGETLTYLWNGGENKTRRKRYIENLVYSDPSFATPNEQNLTRDELYLEGVRKHVLFWKKRQEYNLSDINEMGTFILAATGTNPSSPIMHEVAFLPVLLSQASDEQLSEWLPLVLSFRMVGCYAQTELGHGTFVRGLETTATYEPSTKTFVLNTPNVTSTKWWIGALGKTANHAIVMAQLLIKGRRHGIHAFLVPIRDMDTHKTLPGLTVGDIGPKLGFNTMDNGFLRLDNVRIPRENMLMKYSQVKEDGTYVKPPNDKLIYGGMLGIRANLPVECGANLAAAVTIAIRYSCVRRQSELKPNDVEPQILDYQTQQHKLFPLLASAFAYRLAGLRLLDMYRDVMDEVRSGSFGRLNELHALAAGMKGVVTVRTSWGIEICRLSCGGHGYSMASGLPQLFGRAAAPATAEGEGVVLTLQTARYLMKNCLQSSGDTETSSESFVRYLHNKNLPSSFDGHLDLESIVVAHEFRTAKLVLKAAGALRNVLSKPGMTQELAWNECTVHLLKAAVAHIEYALVRLFAERVTSCLCDPDVKKVLVLLLKVYAVNGIIENAGDYVQEGYFKSSDLDQLRSVLYSCYAQLRPDAVAVVDAFEFHDRMLNSAIGRYDGQVYESLYELAKQSALNVSEVHESFLKYLQPLSQQTAAVSKL